MATGHLDKIVVDYVTRDTQITHVDCSISSIDMVDWVPLYVYDPKLPILQPVAPFTNMV